MISLPILKQTIKENFKLWIVFTFIFCVMLLAIVVVFDPKIMSGVMDMLQGTTLTEEMTQQMDSMSTLPGMLAGSFYSIQGIIIPLIYIIITANSLIASSVDKGSMAYLLSTPTKRSTVVITQGFYLISSVFLMFITLTLVGIVAIQIVHGGIFGKTYTKDVARVAQVFDLDKEELSNNLNVILEDTQKIDEGSKARQLSDEEYIVYLNAKIEEQGYKLASETLGVNVEDVKSNPMLIINSPQTIKELSEFYNISEEEYVAKLQTKLSEMEAMNQQGEAMQNQLMLGLTSAAEVLSMEVTDLANDMEKLKSNGEALLKAVEVSQIPQDTFISIINQQIAANELILDNGIDFEVRDFLMLNLGQFLLMFATGGISFLFSCYCNLSKNSMALGGGIPLIFLLINVVSDIDSSFDMFKYFSLNTLFDPNRIISGESVIVEFAAMFLIGIVLYFVAGKIFVKKDLPL